MPIIETSDLYHRYPQQKKEQKALAEINLKIESGQMWGLLGPDGAGKTTLLRILATVLSPSGGSAHVGGFSTDKQAEKIHRMIGYMPQNFSLYPDLSVIENMSFFADTHGLNNPQKADRLEQMLDFTRLKDFTQRRAGNLSGGMKKKLVLACALIHEPQVLLLDEPSTGVDPVSRRELWLMLSRIVNEGVTVLVSTPYMDEAERCHQVSVLYQGKILAEGVPLDLIQNLPFKIVEVKAKPRMAIREIVQSSPQVISWRPIGDRLRLVVRDPEKAIEDLSQKIQQDDVKVKILRQSRRSMEDFFIHMVEAERNKQ